MNESLVAGDYGITQLSQTLCTQTRELAFLIKDAFGLARPHAGGLSSCDGLGFQMFQIELFRNGFAEMIMPIGGLDLMSQTDDFLSVVVRHRTSIFPCYPT